MTSSFEKFQEDISACRLLLHDVVTLDVAIEQLKILMNEYKDTNQLLIIQEYLEIAKVMKSVDVLTSLDDQLLVIERTSHIVHPSRMIKEALMEAYKNLVNDSNDFNIRYHAQHNCAVVYFLLKRYREAMEAIDEALAILPSTTLWDIDDQSRMLRQYLDMLSNMVGEEESQNSSISTFDWRTLLNDDN